MSRGIGIIGCGNISDTYLANATLFEEFHIAAVADLSAEAAAAKAAQYGTEACTPEALLARADVEIVLNLTVPAAHAAVTTAALTAGKHVYSEKPLAATLEDAGKLLALAEEKGLVLACAPDTVLGPAVQTALGLITKGQLGEIVGGTAAFLAPGVEDFHPSPGFFYQPGGGPVLDMGPYYVAALTTLAGPVKTVRATGRMGKRERIVTAPGPMQGKAVPVDTLTHVNALLTMESGAEITLVMSWEARHHDQPHLEFYGTEGAMQVPDPNYFGGTVKYTEQPYEWAEIDTSDMPFGAPHGWVDYPDLADYRGMGLADMCRALEAGTVPACSGDKGFHVLAVLEAILASAASGETRAVATR